MMSDHLGLHVVTRCLSDLCFKGQKVPILGGFDPTTLFPGYLHSLLILVHVICIPNKIKLISHFAEFLKIIEGLSIVPFQKTKKNSGLTRGQLRRLLTTKMSLGLYSGDLSTFQTCRYLKQCAYYEIPNANSYRVASSGTQL